MNQGVVLTIISDDKPGIVGKIADVINQHDGNWLESNLSYLAGKFAGIIEYSVDETKAEALALQLNSLASTGMTIVIEPVNSKQNLNDLPTSAATHKFSVVGNDRPGIIRDISQAFSAQGINVIELQSDCTSAPHVGTPLFEARGKVNIPTGIDINEFQERLDQICDKLAVDLEFDTL